MSVLPLVRHTFQFPISAFLSQNVTDKSYLVCLESEKYPFWVTLRPLGFIRQGKTEVKSNHIFKTHFSVSSPPQCWSQAVACISIST